MSQLRVEQVFQAHLQVLSELTKPHPRLTLLISGGISSITLLHLLIRHHSYFPEIHLVHALLGDDVASHRAKRLVERIARENRLSLEVADLRDPHGRSGRSLDPVTCQGDRGIFFSAENMEDQISVVLAYLMSDDPEQLSRYLFKESLPPYSNSSTIVRPLLKVSESDLQAYADCYGLHYTPDRRGKDIQSTDGYLRQIVTPLLKRSMSDRIDDLNLHHP